MHPQSILLTILSIATLSSAMTLYANETNATSFSNYTSLMTTFYTTVISTYSPTTAALTTGQTTATNPTTQTFTTASTTTTTSPKTTTTTKVSPTTKAPRRKFDGLSFIGGMILAAGLSGIIFLIVSYLRRSHQLPYSNLS